MSPESLTRPPQLHRGDVVAVVAPSSPVPRALLASGVDVLTHWGLRVRIGEHVHERAHDDILAGSDSARAHDLHTAWTDPDVRAVFCARGGYGSGRLLDLLDWSALAAAGPKLLVGASDVTALHQAWAKRLGLVTLFGPMPASELFAGPAADGPSRQFLHDVLFAPRTVTEGVACDGERPTPGTASLVSGRLVGGTLTLLATALGTPDSVAAADSIALLEDVGEAPYRVDRMLSQLLRAGWFDGVRGIALGSFHECGDVRAVISDRLEPLGVPLVAGFPIGHGVRQLTVPLGQVVELDPGRGRLRFSQPPLLPSA